MTPPQISNFEYPPPPHGHPWSRGQIIFLKKPCFFTLILSFILTCLVVLNKISLFTNRLTNISFMQIPLSRRGQPW